MSKLWRYVCAHNSNRQQGRQAAHRLEVTELRADVGRSDNILVEHFTQSHACQLQHTSKHGYMLRATLCHADRALAQLLRDVRIKACLQLTRYLHQTASCDLPGRGLQGASENIRRHSSVAAPMDLSLIHI